MWFLHVWEPWSRRARNSWHWGQWLDEDAVKRRLPNCRVLKLAFLVHGGIISHGHIYICIYIKKTLSQIKFCLGDLSIRSFGHPVPSAPSAQNDHVLWYREARGWGEIVVSFLLTSENIKESKINIVPEQAGNRNERQRMLSKVISISGVSTGYVLLKNDFALCRCSRPFCFCLWNW